MAAIGKKIILAGGGTAGHIEPALAVARTWMQSHPNDTCVFLGTSHGLEVRLIPEAGFALRTITRVRIPRKVTPSLLLAPLSLIRAIVQSVQYLKGADLLVGFGGYVSGPAYLAALITRTPCVIHEANAKPGLANRLGAYLTPHSAVAYPVSRGRLSRSLIAGLPLRRDVVNAFDKASADWKGARLAAKKSLGFDPQKPLVFIFGGSQGSAAINEVIIAAREYLTSHSIQILHGVGAKNPLPSSINGYRAEPYISDMATAYLAADLIISRSGAVTCAEVNTLGRYALFIPLPIGNGEQRLNAGDLIAQSRATIVDQKNFTPQWLTANISDLIAASAHASIEGSRSDIDATSKIVALMERAMSTGDCE